MKKVYGVLSAGFLFCNFLSAQDLQSVTQNGNTTDRQIVVHRTDGSYGINASNSSDADLLLGTSPLGASVKYAWMQSSFPGRHLVLNPDNGGYIGIGTIAPIRQLTLSNAGAAEMVWSDASQGVDLKHFRWMNANQRFMLGTINDNGTQANDMLTILRSGNMGVGINEPVYKLDVNGNGQFTSIAGAAVIGRHNIPLSSSSYAHGNFEARVSFEDFSSGARPGYGFHASGRHGIYMYAEGQMDLRLKGESGQDATVWTTVNFNPAYYLPITSAIDDIYTVGQGNAHKTLAVNGQVKTRKVIVTQTGWADYVFDSSYQLMSINQVEQFIQKNKHLPEVPSAPQVKKDGVDIGDNQVLLLKKIEELTLYIIQQNNEMKEMKERIKALEAAR